MHSTNHDYIEQYVVKQGQTSTSESSFAADGNNIRKHLHYTNQCAAMMFHLRDKVRPLAQVRITDLLRLGFVAVCLHRDGRKGFVCKSAVSQTDTSADEGDLQCAGSLFLLSVFFNQKIRANHKLIVRSQLNNFPSSLSSPRLNFSMVTHISVSLAAFRSLSACPLVSLLCPGIYETNASVSQLVTHTPQTHTSTHKHTRTAKCQSVSRPVRSRVNVEGPLDLAGHT